MFEDPIEQLSPTDAGAEFVDVSGDTMTGDLIVPDITLTRSLTINRTGTQVDSVEYTGGKTITYTYSSGLLASYTDGTYTWTITRDGDDLITDITVS